MKYVPVDTDTLAESTPQDNILTALWRDFFTALWYETGWLFVMLVIFLISAAGGIECTSAYVLYAM